MNTDAGAYLERGKSCRGPEAPVIAPEIVTVSFHPEIQIPLQVREDFPAVRIVDPVGGVTEWIGFADPVAVHADHPVRCHRCLCQHNVGDDTHS